MFNDNECILHDCTGGLCLRRPNVPLPQYLHRLKYSRSGEVYAPEAGMWGRHGSCRSVGHIPSSPFHRPSRQLASELVYRLDKRASVADHAAAQAGNEAVAEAVCDIACTAEGAFGEIFEVDVAGGRDLANPENTKYYTCLMKSVKLFAASPGFGGSKSRCRPASKWWTTVMRPSSCFHFRPFVMRITS